MNELGGAGGAPAGRPRRGLRRHVRRAVHGDLRRRPRRAARRDARATRRSPTATTRCSSATPSPRARGPAAGSTSCVTRSPRARRPVLRDDPRSRPPRHGGLDSMKLGFLTAPFPETPLMEVADWAAGAGFEVLEIACWPKATGPDPPLRRHEPHRRREPVRRARPREIRRRDRGQGPVDLRASASTPTRSTRTPSTARTVIGHLKQVIEAAEKMDVPLVNTFMGGDGAKNQDENWEEALRVWPDIVAFANDHGREDHARELPDAVQLRRVAGRPQHRDDAADVAPDPRAVGRHDRAQLRPVAPDPPDDRHPAVPQGVRAARPALPGQGPDDRPRRALRARRLLDGHGLADPADPGPRRGRLGRRLTASSTARATRATASSSTRTAASRGPTRRSSRAS